MDTKFSCVGCGGCCTDHHVPLTLGEAAQWAADGGNVIVLTEAFLSNGYGVSETQLTHASRRSTQVNSGSTTAFVAITFAAYNVGRCRNLDEKNLCRIYERRPLVCRTLKSPITTSGRGWPGRPIIRRVPTGFRRHVGLRCCAPANQLHCEPLVAQCCDSSPFAPFCRDSCKYFLYVPSGGASAPDFPGLQLSRVTLSRSGYST